MNECARLCERVCHRAKELGPSVSAACHQHRAQVVVQRGEHAGQRWAKMTLGTGELLQGVAMLDENGATIPEHLGLAYIRLMLACASWSELGDTPRLAVLGLGTAALPMALQRCIPGAEVHTVELNYNVIEAAKTHFGFGPSPSMQLHHDCAGAHFSRASCPVYNAIFVDVYRPDGLTAEALGSVDFCRELDSHLTPEGAVVLNIAGESEYLVKQAARQYASVFPNVYTLEVPCSHFANVVLVASKKENRRMIKEATETAREFSQQGKLPHDLALVLNSTWCRTYDSDSDALCMDSQLCAAQSGFCNADHDAVWH